MYELAGSIKLTDTAHKKKNSPNSFSFFFLLLHSLCSFAEISETKEEMNNLRGKGRLITSAVPEVEAKNFQGRPDNDEFEEIFGDSCTVGSTSKSSSEWRSSTINYRNSSTEDPFSSSSRRSCPKWESYTVFQKYDEEMTFLDRISAQKLDETGSWSIPYTKLPCLSFTLLTTVQLTAPCM